MTTEPEKIEGITIKSSREREVEPPLAGKEEEKVEEVKPQKPTTYPILPTTVKLPLRFEGKALAEFTGFPGWEYSEEELNDIAELVRETGVMAPAWLQLLLSILALHAVKGLAFLAWRRAGGKLKKKEEKI